MAVKRVRNGPRSRLKWMKPNGWTADNLFRTDWYDGWTASEKFRTDGNHVWTAKKILGVVSFQINSTHTNVLIPCKHCSNSWANAGQIFFSKFMTSWMHSLQKGWLWNMKPCCCSCYSELPDCVKVFGCGFIGLFCRPVRSNNLRKDILQSHLMALTIIAVY